MTILYSQLSYLTVVMFMYKGVTLNGIATATG